jgi:imidazole glycerol-phosphate synthase subunit HisF
MLKTRVVPVLLWDEHGCVKGRQFDSTRRIGSMMDRVRLMERREVDELIILDIAATPNKRGPRFEEVSQLTENLFMPVTVGGGVKNVSDIKRLLAGGADKVAIGTAALAQPDLIADASQKFGAQAVVASIDCRGMEVFTGPQRMVATGRHCKNTAVDFERHGAGEILLTSIDRDGTLEGYDLDLIREVTEAVSIPVIACGGCGSYEHMEQAINAGAHAVAVGAMFQFCEQTPRGASRYLNEHGIAAR